MKTFFDERAAPSEVPPSFRAEWTRIAAEMRAKGVPESRVKDMANDELCRRHAARCEGAKGLFEGRG